MVFENRLEAGRALAKKLVGLRGSDNQVVVLAIPRGGVVIGKEIANSLSCPLGIVVTKKLGAPGNSELAIGAVDPDGKAVLNKELASWSKADRVYIQKEKKTIKKEIKRRMCLFHQDKRRLFLRGKIVVLTDDGIATGATMEAAINWVKRRLPEKIILAVPVASPDSLAKLKKSLDEAVCLLKPTFFAAVGQFYRHFPQTDDKEVIKILQEAKG